MRMAEAWKTRIAPNPGKRYQVYVQHPQNWHIKGWIAVFEDDGTDKSAQRCQRFGERFIGVFDSSVGEREFYEICTYSCLLYQQRVKRWILEIVDVPAAMRSGWQWTL